MGALAILALAAGACGNDDQPDLALFCERLETAFGPEGSLTSDYSDDPSAAKVIIDDLEAVRSASPLEIEPSLALIIETSILIIGAFKNPEDSGLDSEQATDQLLESGIAAAELASYSTEHCDLDLDWESPVVFVEPDRITGEVDLNVPG